MKIYLILLSIILNSSVSTAKTIKISLKNVELDIPEVDFYIKSIVDKREDTLTLGTVYGQYEEEFTFKAETTLKKELFQLFSNTIQMIGKKPVEVEINVFKIKEAYNNMYGLTQVELTFIDKNPYAKLKEYKTSAVSSNVGRSPALPNYNTLIKDALSFSLTKYYLMRRWGSVADSVVTPKKDILPGLYLNIEDLRSNTPSINKTAKIKLKETRMSIECELPNVDHKTVYAINDGKNTWISMYYHNMYDLYCPLREKTDDYLIVNVTQIVEFKRSQLGGMALGGSFGLVGAALGVLSMVLNSSFPDEDQTFVLIDFKSKRAFSVRYETFEKLFKAKPGFYKIFQSQPRSTVEKDPVTWIRNFYAWERE